MCAFPRALVALLAFAAMCVSATPAFPQHAQRPNVVIILLDDVGYDKIQPFGSEVATPNIEAIAAQGVRLTQYYSAPLCSPARASILTGQHPQTFGIATALPSQSTVGVSPKFFTLPEMLRAAGYQSIEIGKWHLGSSEMRFRPLQFGFDLSRHLYSENFGHYGFSISFNDSTPTLYDRSDYSTTTLTNLALDFLDSRDASRPFFLYLPYLAAHAPYSNPDTFSGIDAYDLSVASGRYKAMIAQADEQIGRVVQKLNDLGLAENTLLIVTNDNGGPSGVNTRNGIFRGFKGEVFEGGIRVPLVARWPNHIPIGVVNTSVVANIDLMPTIGHAVGASLGKTKIAGEDKLAAFVSTQVLGRAKPLVWNNSASGKSEDDFATEFVYAVRDGAWKYVFSRSKQYLFNLELDPGELNNRASFFAQKVQQLDNYYREWHRKIARINYSYSKSSSTHVQLKSSDFLFKTGQGGVTLKDPDASRIGDSDFTFLTALRLAPNFPKKYTAIVAQSPGFTLQVTSSRRLEAVIHSTAQGLVTLKGKKLLPGSKSYRVGLSIFERRSGGLVAQLYIDGKKYAQAQIATGHTLVGEWPMVLGRPAPQLAALFPKTGGFVGKLQIPRLHRTYFDAIEMKQMNLLLSDQ